MAISFRIASHSDTEEDIVEILVDDKVAGVVYPAGEKSIKIVSAHIEETEKDEEFSGEVVEDDGSRSWPPIPAVLIRFNPSPYEIKGGRIIKYPVQNEKVS